MRSTRALASVVALAGLTSVASGASVSMSGFDQVAKINALGGSVKQIGGAAPGASMATGAGFAGTVSETTGVTVTLPGWKFLSSVISLTDVGATQVGNASAILTGAPTDITYTVPGANGPDGGPGDGSFSMTNGDSFRASFGQVITALAGVTNDLFIFTDTDGGGRFTVDILLNGVVVDTLATTATVNGGVGTGLGGFLINVTDGKMYNEVRINAFKDLVEIDAIAAYCIPNPAAAGLGAMGLGLVAGARRRRIG